MRSSKNRSRSKSNRQRSLGNIINRVFDSSGPENKVRGTPQQIIDKYLGLARDAQLSNDRVAEQNFLQHAEHYTRMLSEAQREMQREQENRQQNGQDAVSQNGSSGQPGGYGQQPSGDDRGGDRNGDRNPDRGGERNADRGGERSADRGGDRNGERTGDRPQQNRRRNDDQRSERGGDEQRRSALIADDRNDDEGPGLVETPEARMSATPTSSMMPNLSQVAVDAPTQASEGDAPRKPVQRRPRKPKVKAEDSAAEAPAVSND
jgi:hypothetical protein